MTAQPRLSFRLLALAALAATALPLAACDWIKGSTSSDTKMKNVEILPGTASDEMVTLDSASADGTALDPNAAVGPAAPSATAAPAAGFSPSTTAVKPAESASSGTGDEGDAPDGGTTSRDVIGRDVTIRPPSGGAESTTPAARPAHTTPAVHATRPAPPATNNHSNETTKK